MRPRGNPGKVRRRQHLREHRPAEGAAALAALTQPVISPSGTRTAAMPVTSPRVQALLAALLTDRNSPQSAPLRAAARAYDAALDDLARHAGLAE